MNMYTFKQIQETLDCGSDFSVKGHLFVRFPEQIKANLNKVEYNETECLVAQMQGRVLNGNEIRRGKKTTMIPVQIVKLDENGKTVATLDGFISPANIFFQSAREDETRVSVPPWYGNESAYEESIELAKQVENMVKALAEKNNISVDQARDMLKVAKSDI